MFTSYFFVKTKKINRGGISHVIVYYKSYLVVVFKIIKCFLCLFVNIIFLRNCNKICIS